MRMPGFNGESSLHGNAQHYGIHDSQDTANDGVSPAQLDVDFRRVVCGPAICGIDPMTGLFRYCWRCRRF